MEKSVLRAYIALIAGAIFIGFSPVLIRICEAPGIVSSFYRLLFGAMVLFVPFIILWKKGRCRVTKKGLFFAVMAGLCFALDMALWSTGIMRTNATIPTLVGNLSPLWVGLGAMFIFKERQHFRFWLGLLLAVSGVAMLALRDFFVPQGMLPGILFGLFSGMFYAGYMLLSQPGRRHLDAVSFLFLASLSTAVFLGLYMLFAGYSFSNYSTYSFTIFIIMGVCFQAGAWFLITYAQGYLPASIVSPTLLSQPVVAAIAAYFIAGEELGVWSIVAGVVVLSGIFCVHYSNIVRRRK